VNNYFKSKLPIVPSLLHIILTAIFLFVLYLIFGPATILELEMINEILWLIIIPFILIVGTIVSCIIVGLPIRIIQKVYDWWSARPMVSFFGLLTGLVLMTLTLNDGFMEKEIIVVNKQELVKEVPNNYLLLFGWFLTAFFMLHFYPKHFFNHLKQKFNSNNS
jgi:hypothetical protein